MNEEPQTLDWYLDKVTEITGLLESWQSIFDKYCGKTKDELGEALFGQLIDGAEKVVLLMAAKENIRKICLEKFGAFVM